MLSINRWFQPTHASALAVFRIGLGLILCWDMLRYGFFLDIERYYQQPDFLFYYWHLDWVKPLSQTGMQSLFAVLAVAAFCITLGFFYRTSLLVFICGFSYIFLLDEARYLNHFYMVWLFSVLMLFIPANRLWSIDSYRKAPLNTQVPVWCYGILIFQLEVILIYAGLVKLTPDWLALEPLKTWLSYRADMAVFGSLFTQDWAIATAAYGVIALHLIGAPLLLFKATRVWIILLYACFHTLNHFVFTIGIFPWMTLFTSLLVFGADWPIRLWTKIKSLLRSPPSGLSSGSKQITRVSSTQLAKAEAFIMGANRKTIVAAVVITWCLLQVAIPLRHFAYPGQVAWTEEGHRFAWRMKLRTKRGTIRYRLVHANGMQQSVKHQIHLNKRQLRRLPCQPDMIWKLAKFLKQHYSTSNNPVVGVYSEVFCSLNGRPVQKLIAPTTNLLAVNYDIISPSPWILPLTTELPTR